MDSDSSDDGKDELSLPLPLTAMRKELIRQLKGQYHELKHKMLEVLL